jgi:hypothetical protein
MTVVNYETGEVLDVAAAERRAERITLRLDAIADNYAAVMPMIREAIEKRDDLALAYRSPGDYVSDRFGGSLQRLGVDVRRAVVGELTAAGLSTRAIAPVVGVSQSTIRDDVKVLRDVSSTTHLSEAPEAEGSRNASPTSDASARADGAAMETAAAPRPLVTDVITGEQIEDKRRPTVVGIDGKTYTRPARVVPRPEAEKTLNALEMYAAKAARAAEGLTPDQIRRIKPKADLWTVGLRESVETLQRLLTSLTEEK